VASVHAAKPSPWSASAAPLPANAAANPESIFVSQACPAAGTCVAVGSYIDTSGDEEGLIETLSDGVWTPTMAPLPTTANAGTNPDAVVTSVSCVAAGSCVAVGGYAASKTQSSGLVEVLSGGTWTPKQIRPAGLSDITFSAVTCPAAGSCVVVGDDSGASGAGGVVGTLSHGTWTVTAAPIPPNAPAVALGLLGAVTCPAVGSCVAVGADISFGLRSATEEGLIETLSAGQWTAIEAPLASKKSAHSLNSLDSVACSAVGSCVAGGSAADKSDDGGQGLLETLSNGTWSPVEVPLPANATADQSSPVSSVACTAVGSCVAVAGYTDLSGNQQGLIEMLANGAWTGTEAPLPPDAGADPEAALGGVSCPSAGSCVAVGGYTDTAGTEQGLVDTLSDGTWTATQAPLPSVTTASFTASAATSPARLSSVGWARTLALTTRDVTAFRKFTWIGQFTGSMGLTLPRRASKVITVVLTAPPVLSSVSCVTTAACATTGSLDSNTSQEGVIDTLSAGTWTTSDAVPADATLNTFAQLQAVSCGAPASCLAVGTYDDTTGANQGLIETQSGDTWNPSDLPAPADAAPAPEIELNGVTCPAVGSCLAVGTYADASGNFEGLVETLADGTWTATDVPLPAGATDSDAELTSVSCPEVGTCVAVGTSYAANGLVGLALIETLSSGTWTPSVPPIPGKVTARSDSGLSSVACPAVGSCQAVGAYAPNGRYPLGLVETLTAGTWSPTEVKAPGDSTAKEFLVLESVSCAEVGTCVAVGGYLDIDGEHGIIDTLNDGTWTPTEARPPSKADSSDTLSDVSCPSSGGCVAVGSYQGNSEGNVESIMANFFETLQGKKWTPSLAATPPGGFAFFSLVSVSCAVVGSCASVGYDESTRDGVGGVIETLSGSQAAS
jgi:hypothetical protein